MVGTYWPNDFRLTIKTLPCVRVLNGANNGFGQIVQDAFLAENIWAIGATIDFAALAAPSAIQFAAIFALTEFATIVESVTFFAVSDAQHRMHTDDGLAGRCRADVRIASGTMQMLVNDGVNVWVRGHVK